MRKAVGIATAALLGATTLISQGSFAQTTMNHGAMPMTAEHALSDGEVRKIDKETGKITIRHGPIKHLDMPPMSMVFTSKDPALLDKAKSAGILVTGGTEFRGMYSKKPLSVGAYSAPDQAVKALLTYKSKIKRKKAKQEER